MLEFDVLYTFNYPPHQTFSKLARLETVTLGVFIYNAFSFPI